MRSNNTFGIHFVLRTNRGKNGKAAIYVRIVVNKSRSEIALKRLVEATDWNQMKGLAKPKNEILKSLNSYLEQTRCQLSSYYQEFIIKNKLVTAEALKNRFIGIEEEQNTLVTLMDYHNLHMKEVLAPGTIKNYYTTMKYLKEFVSKQFKKNDLYLSELDYQLITQFEYFLRTYQPVDHHKGMENNGVMKHLERFRKMIRLGVKLGWMEKNPFELFQLKMQKVERGFLTTTELTAIEQKEFSIQRIQYAI